jgi:hypothetical protein
MSIFRREFAAKRDILLIAVAALAIVYLMPHLPGFEGQNPGDVRTVSSQILAVGLGWALAVGLGATVFGSDLSAGRFGFFFARPVGAAAVWAGRMLAALAIALACEVVVMLPTLVTEEMHPFRLNEPDWGAIGFAFFVLPAALLLLSHGVSIMLRARTAWLFLDLAALLAVAAGSWVTVRPLVLMGAATAVTVMGSLLVGAAVIALAFAGLVGTAVGRTDLRRTHGAMSMALWSLLGVAVACLLVYSGWLRGFGPAQMDDVEVFSVAPDGGWIEVWGSAPWRLDVQRRVLISSDGDRYLMLPPSSSEYRMELIYSADGGTAIGLDSMSGSENLSSLWWADLSADIPKLVETLLVIPSRTIPALSPDGSRVAILEEGTLSVHDLVSEQLVAAIRLPVSFRKATVLFFEHDRLRLFARSGEDESSMMLIAEVDLEKRAVEETGRIEGVQRSRWMALNRSAERMMLSVRDDNLSVTRRSLRNARDGSLIRELRHRGSVRFLEDGRTVVLTDAPGDGAQLLVESADGSTKITHSLGEVDWEGLGGEALPGQVVVGRLSNLDERTQGRRFDLIDVDSGEIRSISTGLRKVHPGFQWVWGGGGMVFWYVDSPESNRIFTDRAGAIVRWDPETGDLEHIIGGSQ